MKKNGVIPDQVPPLEVIAASIFDTIAAAYFTGDGAPPSLLKLVFGKENSSEERKEEGEGFDRPEDYMAARKRLMRGVVADGD